MNLVEQIDKLNALKTFQNRYEHDWKLNPNAAESLSKLIDLTEKSIFNEINRQVDEYGYIE